MNCGCSNPHPVSTCCGSPVDESVIPTGQYLFDKFFDKTIASFTMPAVGSTCVIAVENPKRFTPYMFVCVVLSKTKYAYFKILEVGQQNLKVLNGYELGNPNNGIYGNPESGKTFEAELIVLPSPQIGQTDLPIQFSNLLASYGEAGILKVLNETDEIKLFSTPELATDETAFLFGGTTETCDCAPEQSGLVASWLRKIRNIFTGQSGKTLCMPEASVINEADVTVDGNPVSKRLAYFDEKGCLKKGRKVLEVVDDHHKVVPKYLSVYNGGTSLVTLNITSLGLPKQIGSRQRYAIFEIWLVIAGVAGCQFTGYINGSSYLTVYTGASGGADQGSRQVAIPVTDNQNITFQGLVTAGSPTTASAAITLLRFEV